GVTAPTAVLRLHGRNAEGWLRQRRGEAPSVREKYDYLYTEAELQALRPEIQELEAESERVVIAFHHNNRDYPVQNARMLRRLPGGTLQCNCCRTVAAVSARLGLRAVLALKGSRPSVYDGNLLLDKLLGAELRYCTDEEWAKVDDVLADLEARVRARGGRPYVIPESGATVVGALGYMACAREIREQTKHGAPDFDTIVITAFSGGRRAGLRV